MLDLNTDSVHAFWDSYDRRTLYRIIVGLESVEYWTLDESPKVENLLLAFGQAIESADEHDLNDEALIRILSNLKAGRALRILQAIDTKKPGTASQLLMFAEEASQDNDTKPANPHAKIFLKRNLIFERLQLLSRVFSPQRLSLVLKSLEQENV